MSEGISQLLGTPGGGVLREAALTHIDGMRDLLLCSNCGGTYRPVTPELVTYIRAFRRLVGHEPKGKVRLEFNQPPTVSRLPKDSLKFCDDESCSEFPVEARVSIAWSLEQGTHLFGVFYHEGYGRSNPQSESYLGKLRLLNGSELSVVINMNMLYALEISIVENDGSGSGTTNLFSGGSAGRY